MSNISKTVSNIIQPSWNHPFVTFNNQNSVLMRMSVPVYNLLCLLHDNRIFAFRSTQKIQEDVSPSIEQDLLLAVLTTPKYRALSIMYIIFRLLDNVNFILIIVLSIKNTDFSLPTPTELALLSAIGLEVFYDVMLYTHRYWILQRLSLHIGLVLYCLYALIVAYKNLKGGYTVDQLHIIICVLSIRFGAFIFEECVDVAIDGILHNDLLKLQKDKTLSVIIPPEEVGEDAIDYIEEDENFPRVETYNSSLFSCLKIRNYMNIRNSIKMPDNVEYMGSIFAWGPKTVFARDVWNTEQFPFWGIFALCVIPFVITSVLFLIITMLCFIAFLIPVILGYVFSIFYLCTCNTKKIKERLTSSNFWRELTHF